MPTVSEASDPRAWNSFLASQQFRPFLQSWEMGEVYRDIGQNPIRLEVCEGNDIVGMCFGHIVPARRGRHLSIPYGPVSRTGDWELGTGNIFESLLKEITRIAKEARCSFIRLSPFWPSSTHYSLLTTHYKLVPAPLHLLAEHLWYLPLAEPDPWSSNPQPATSNQQPATAQTLFARMRATTRNLIRRAEKEGVTITASDDPIRDLPIFLRLHDETRKRHRFTPYTDAFFRAQVKHFSPLPAARCPLTAPHCSLYLANYKSDVIAASIHVHFAGETSYHHGASTERYRNIPSSYLLQWRAIQDAIARGDHVYNFWGIAPSNISLSPCKKNPCPAKHPFAGVTLFKTGFGGKALELTHCMDIPLKPSYYLTRGFEMFRKWRRGF